MAGPALGTRDTRRGTRRRRAAPRHPGEGGLPIPSHTAPRQPSGCSGSPERAAAPAAVRLQQRQTPRRTQRGLGPGPRPRRSPRRAQAPPFAPHRNLGRLRRRKALGWARRRASRGAAGTCRLPRPRSCAGRPGHRIPAGRGWAVEGPGRPHRSCLSRARGRADVSRFVSGSTGRWAPHTDAKSGKQPLPPSVWGAWGRVLAGRCLAASIPLLCASGACGQREKGPASYCAMLCAAPPLLAPGSAGSRGRYELHQLRCPSECPGSAMGPGRPRPGCQVPRSQEACRKSPSSRHGGI